MSAQTYKELHAEKAKLEIKETLASARQILQIVKICAKNAISFEEFAFLLGDSIAKIEAKMNE